MDKLANKKKLLNRIRLSEDNKFDYNKKGILNEYYTQYENKSCLPIKGLTVCGGFIATLAFLSFLITVEPYNSELGLLFFGIGFIVIAIGLNIESDKLIIDTFSISMYIIGLTMFSMGLLLMEFNESTVALLIILIALASLIITQNFTISFISILIVGGSFLTLIIENNLYNLIYLYVTIYTLALTYCFLNEAKLISLSKKFSKLYNPIRIGLIISLLFGLILIGKRHLIPISLNYIWLPSIGMFFVITYLVNTIIKINKVIAIKNKVLIYALIFSILASALFSPSITGAIIVILLSFLVNYKTGFTIGILALIYFVSQYYYDLNFTLLTKSIMMFSSGIIFLLFYFITTKFILSNEKV